MEHNKTGKKRRLGRGLGSLISSPVEIGDISTEDQQPGLHMLETSSIRANPKQPRQKFDERSLAALADSIQSAGIMQPIVVRPASEGGYEIIAGERRWRAAQRIGLTHLPSVVREVDDRTATEWALVENLQREDLNPVERSNAFHRLADDFGLTQQQIAEGVGLDRSSVANIMRIKDLDEFTVGEVQAGRLHLGHAKALLTITNQDVRQDLARKAVAHHWSVRELERRIRRMDESPPSTQTQGSSREHHLADLERRLGEHLGTKVRIQTGRKKGVGNILIEFYSFAEFEGILQQFGFDSTTEF